MDSHKIWTEIRGAAHKVNSVMQTTHVLPNVASATISNHPRLDYGRPPSSNDSTARKVAYDVLRQIAAWELDGEFSINDIGSAVTSSPERDVTLSS